MALENWIKKEILDQPAYNVKTVDYRIKLNQNECPWDFPIEMKTDITDKILNADWNRYPALIPRQLQEKIAKKINVRQDQVIVGKGSNEVLQAIITAGITDSKVCTLSPTFVVYRMLAEQNGATVVTSNLDGLFHVNRHDLLEKSKDCGLIILCNPNSPTGTLIDTKTILEVLQSASGLVIIDEAYAEFSDATLIPVIDDYPNLIITRTFSKVFGLAGFRMGYGVMSSVLANQVQKSMLPFNIDMPSAIAAETILDHQNQIRDRVRVIISERERISSALNGMEGFKVYPSAANFIVVKAQIGTKTLFNRLAKQGILIRDISAYRGCENMARITVGTPAENTKLIEAIENIR